MPGLRARGGGVLAALTAAVLLLAGCTQASIEVPEPAAPDVGVQLFQLPWTSVAQECESTLAPAGIAWVLLSPAQEHIDVDEWWASYQPVSYQIESRLGTRAEFADMVQRCTAAGVGVIADAVINHMTGQDAPGIGYAGSAYAHYEYPGIYDESDFRHCGLTAGDDIQLYKNREQVQTCELVNLADLDTANPGVQATIVAYLDDLLSLGVSGFRIDAAKHIPADDVEAIVSQLPEGTRIMSEVIRGAGEPIAPEEYEGFGEVFEFTYARELTPPLENGVFADPVLSDDRPQQVPSDAAIVFVDNHDTERGEANVTAKDPELYVIANALMLADDYGTPVLFSGYAFSDRDAGAPTDADGRVLDAACVDASGPAGDLADGERTCVQSWPAIAGMLEFRAMAAGTPRMPGVDEGDAYGFEREGRGVVAVNVGDDVQRLEVPTTMPDGAYCDVVSGGAGAAGDGGCAGREYAVSNGVATFDLDPHAAAAIHLGSRR